MTSSAKVSSQQRRTLQAAADAVVWVFGMVFAVAPRLDFTMPAAGWATTIVLGLIAALLQLAVGYGAGLYRGRYAYGSFNEVKGIGWTVIGIVALLSLLIIPFSNAFLVLRGTVVLAGPFVLVMMFGIRYVARARTERSRTPADDAEPTLIAGAGYLGDRLLHSIITDPTSPIRPVGLLDDDPAKKNLVLRGVPVLGRTSQLASVAQQTGATRVIIAMGNVDSARLREWSDRADAAGVSVAVTPSLTDIMLDPGGIDVRDIEIEDLIGRHPVDTNVELIAGYVTGKRVLVTGAGGSIGSELCRQLSKFEPAELIMLDRDETGLQQAQLGTAGHGLLDTRDVVLANIRDEDVLNDIFEERRPEVVFHAAALKHLPMLEQYPDEAWKTNVLGSLTVIRAAMNVGVTHFVNVSTDKAANPTSVLGHSKRMAEKLTAWAGEQTGMNYVSVRFGNVIGSRGSMLPTFQTLIASGGPITVTHPDATRYFMTIPEACQLVIQAGGIGRAGEVLILDMGEPVSILEVAKRMIAMSGKKIEIVFTGLRHGEKLHEDLVGDGESLERPSHPSISHTRADTISPDRLDADGWKVPMAEKLQNSNTQVLARSGRKAPQG